MRAKIPVLGVVGHRKSGKTAVIERVVRELTKRGYRVATAKHTGQKGFSMDAKGKDTWRHSMAGANPVVCVSDVETAVLIKNGGADFALDKLFEFLPEVDVLMLEGFSKLVLDDETIGKILCVRNREEYEDLGQKARGEIVASCSTQPLGSPILTIKEDSILTERTLEYVEGKILEFKSGLKTMVIVNDTDISLNPFVSEIIRKSVLGMASSLKGVSISGNEEVLIKILS